jgi:predicted Zn-dependent protease with MMP-like domain
MRSGHADPVKSSKFNRRPHSRGVPAPARKPHHGLLARLQLLWTTMTPIPRLLVMAAVVVAVGYGIVAAFVLLPMRAEEVVAYLLPPLVIVVAVLIWARREPNDQAHVHAPESEDVPESEESDAPERLSAKDFDALEDRVDSFAQEPEPEPEPEHKPRSAASRRSGFARGHSFDPAHNEDDFRTLVAQAIDALPPEFADALDHVAVTVSDQGSVQRRNGRLQPLYGLYVGYGGRGQFLGSPRPADQPDRIIIFRDTLSHDYGSDPDRLREQVTRTLRHELAHHLGYDEPGVHALGL